MSLIVAKVHFFMLFGVKKFYNMRFARFLLYTTSWIFSSLGTTKVRIGFLLDVLLHYWFFINEQISTEWKFAFLNTAIIIFCLIYNVQLYIMFPSAWVTMGLIGIKLVMSRNLLVLIGSWLYLKKAPQIF